MTNFKSKIKSYSNTLPSQSKNSYICWFYESWFDNFIVIKSWMNHTRNNQFHTALWMCFSKWFNLFLSMHPIWSLSLSPSVNARKNESPEEKSQPSFYCFEEVRFRARICTLLTYFWFSFICNAIISYFIV